MISLLLIPHRVEIWCRVEITCIARSQPRFFGCRGVREPGVSWMDGIASRGKIYAISGVGNYLGAHAERLVPRQFVTRMAAKMLRPSA